MTVKTRNTMTRQQLRQIEDMLDLKKNEFREQRLTKQEVAVRLSELLKLEVTAGNVTGAAKAIGLEWWNSGRRRTNSASTRIKWLVFEDMVELNERLAKAAGEQIPPTMAHYLSLRRQSL